MCLFLFISFLLTSTSHAAPPPVITVQPLDQTVIYGGTATFTVAATSGTTLSYQWYKDGLLILNQLLTGQTSSSLTLVNVGDSDVGQYFVKVSNAGGTVTSRKASLTVIANSPPVANADIYPTQEDVPLLVPAPGILANDTDVNGQTLTAQLLTNVSQGSLIFSNNGAFTYTPPSNYFGSVSFAYRVSDGYPVILEQDDSGGSSTQIDDGERGAQSFRHGNAGDASYLIKKIIVYLSRENRSASPLGFSVGTGINSGAVGGSTVAIPYANITDTSKGVSFQKYEIVYGSPIGPFTAGTTYYLNLDNQTGKKVYVEHFTGVSTYANGTFYYSGSVQNEDMRFQIYEPSFSNPATVTINVLPVNDPPIAVNDSTNTLEGASVTIKVLANDFDVEGDALTITGTSTTNGTAVISGTNVVFLADTNFHGIAVFTYTVSDGTNSTTASVTVAVIPRPPSITNPPQSQTVTQGLTASLSVGAGGTAPLSYQWQYWGNNLAGATNATLLLNNVQLVQAGNYTVTVSNVAGTAVSAPARLTVVMPGGSDLPVMQDLVAHLTFDGDLTDTSGRGNHAAAVGAPNIVPGFIGTGGFNPFTQKGTNNYATFGSPSDLSFGTNTHFSIAFWARLPAGGWSGSSYYEPPFICNKNFATYGNVGWTLATGANGALEWNYSEGSPKNYFGPAGTFGTTNWHHIAVTFQRGGNGICYLDGVPVSTNSISPGGGSTDSGLPTNIGNDGTGNYPAAYGYFTNAFGTPAKGLNMDDVGIWRRVLSRSEVRAIYNVGLAGQDLASVTTRDVGAPIAGNDITNTLEDVSVTVNVLANDSDPESLPLTITGTSTTNGTAIINGNKVVFTPSANFNGPTAFYYTVSNGTLMSTGKVTVVVSAVNDVPVANNDIYTTSEDAPLIVPAAGILANDTDVEGDVLTAQLASSVSNGTLSLNADGSFTYTPNTNFNGSDGFSYRVKDGSSTGNVAIVTINVTPVNDAPVAANDAYTCPEDATLTVPINGLLSTGTPGVGILGDDTDVDGDTLTAVLVSGVTHGALTLNADGSFSYTPDADYYGPDSFTYRATDGAATGNVATVTINVTPVSDPLRFTSQQMTTNGFELHVAGDAPAYVISASTNLQDWTPIFTNAAPTGSMVYTDTDAPNYPSRFYRVEAR